MRPALPCLLLLLLLGTVRADGILLADGRRLSGRVTENKEKDGYEIVVDGQTLAFAKKDVQQWIKNPREVLGDADRLFENAKRVYQEAIAMADDKAAEPKYREALPMVQKARDAYAEARDYFPDCYPELDTQLVNIMKLMRLVRERIGSQFAGGGSTAPVKAKKSPPPVRATAKAAPRARSSRNTRAKASRTLKPPSRIWDS